MANVDTMPNNILLKILGPFDVLWITTLRLVCKRFDDALWTCDDVFWREHKVKILEYCEKESIKIAKEYFDFKTTHLIMDRERGFEAAAWFRFSLFSKGSILLNRIKDKMKLTFQEVIF